MWNTIVSGCDKLIGDAAFGFAKLFWLYPHLSAAGVGGLVVLTLWAWCAKPEPAPSRIDLFEGAPPIRMRR